jgi:4-hydroxybutyryl-CoA dehydratase/vinylacetyl-CoA-Delta-isomerase
VRTAAEYRESLRDGRTVYYRGQLVPDVTTHPVTSIAVNHAAIDYELADDPSHRALAVVPTEDGEVSRYWEIPRTSEDLLLRARLIEASTREGATLVTLIREIGGDALFALMVLSQRMLDSEEAEAKQLAARVEDYFEQCRAEDLAVCVAQTDVKGDRSRGPSEQAAPDLYLRVVEERDDGIVVSGAKAHTSVSVNSNEMIVLPTRAMKREDADYALAFAVPIATPGLRLVASGYMEPKGAFERPVSAHHLMLETLTIFDGVFVPWERVFLYRQPDWAGPLALGFVEFHRFTAVAYKLPLLDALVGCAVLAAQQNGILSAGHVREKLVRLIAYAETHRALVESAGLRGRVVPPGICRPDPLTTNICKYLFAEGYHKSLRDVQDLAGGLAVTGPSEEDIRHDELGPLIDHYLSGADTSGVDRLRTMYLITDLTAGEYGGYQQILTVHAEGSLEAEKLTALRAADLERYADYARGLIRQAAAADMTAPG